VSTTPASRKLAFIGTGIMGLPMAGHLLRAGHSLTVHSRTQAKARPLLDAGATWADTPAAAAKNADVVILCVTDTPDVEHVVLGADGIVHAARRGLLVVDHSTISPTATRHVAEALAALGADFIDAPVSGGDVGAKNGTLSIMCGGNEDCFRKAQPLLACYGKTITLCGPAGAGQLTKLVNQILVSVTLLAVSEALSFAEKSGLDVSKTVDAVSGGAARSWQLEQLGPKMVAGDWRPGFMVDLMQKDLRLVLEWAEQSKLSLPAASLVHQLFNAAQAAGHGRDGTQSLFTVLQKLSALH
jgi:3-hydroxyisobutyrate dehydrogenase